MISKEALDEMFDLLNYDQTRICDNKNLYDIIQQDLKRLEMLEKAIEILKEYKNILLYNGIDGAYELGWLKNKDYELLKEVFENEL